MLHTLKFPVTCMTNCEWLPRAYNNISSRHLFTLGPDPNPHSRLSLRCSGPHLITLLQNNQVLGMTGFTELLKFTWNTLSFLAYLPPEKDSSSFQVQFVILSPKFLARISVIFYETPFPIIILMTSKKNFPILRVSERFKDFQDLYYMYFLENCVLIHLQLTWYLIFIIFWDFTQNFPFNILSQ